MDEVDAWGIAALVFWIAFWIVKLISIPILIVNIVYLVSAANAGTVGTFDFLWLILSAIGVLVL